MWFNLDAKISLKDSQTIDEIDNYLKDDDADKTPEDEMTSQKPEDSVFGKFEKPAESENTDGLFIKHSKSCILPGQAFGDFSKLLNTKYTPCYAVVESDTAKYLQLDKKHVSSLVKKMSILLSSNDFDFSKMSSIARSRLGG